MQHVRFRDPAGSVRTGEWLDDGVRFGDRTYDVEAVDVLPPTEPSKIVCVGMNYHDHVEEIGGEIPGRPRLFLKGPNTLSAHGDTVELIDRERVDHEGEFGVVIGEQCRHVPENEAMDVVAGFTCVNDVSNRTDQGIDGSESDLFRGKAFDNAAPIGPTVATPEEVPDDARVVLRVNGDTRQDSSRSQLLFSVPDLVAEITAYVTLEPEDVIATGTPAGVDLLADGDTVEIDVEGIPTLRHDVAE
jgi:2-keto-4-pentenoate hydratase/2-oxohepta-3-ene-1,7-dioic acid hydratase in catechol pathway